MNKRNGKRPSTQHKRNAPPSGTRMRASGAGSRHEPPKPTASRQPISQYTVKEAMELLPFLLLKNAKSGRNAVKALLSR